MIDPNYFAFAIIVTNSDQNVFTYFWDFWQILIDSFEYLGKYSLVLSIDILLSIQF